MSHTSLPAASASSPGLANGTYCTGTPSRSAMARAMLGETPSGSPEALRPVTSRKLDILMAARSTPCGASWLLISGVMPALPLLISTPRVGGGTGLGQPGPGQGDCP